MKKLKSTLKIFLFLTITHTASAQYGNDGYGGGNANGMGRGQMQHRQDERPKEIPAEEHAKKMLSNLKEKLQLDELQTIAITNIITNSLRQQGVILKKDNNDDDKMEDIKALSETMDRKIMEFLSKNQKEKYQTIIEERIK